MQVPIPGIPSFGKWTDIATKFAGSGLGRSTLEFLATPPLGNLHAEFELNQKRQMGEKIEEPSGITKAINFLKNTFAWGDIVTLAGACLWYINSKFLSRTAEGQQPSPVSGILGLVSKIATFGGTLLARLGQKMDLHRQKILGAEKYGEAYITRAENITGKKVFEDIPIDGIKKKAKNLKKLLAYNSDIERNVLYRHDSERGITGLFYGEPGTGKTTGAELVLGNWSSKQQSLGYEPVVKKLNVAVLDEYQEKTRKQINENVDLLKSMNEEAAKLLGKTLDDPLVALEMLLRKARAAVDEVNQYNESIKNDPTKKQRKIALFIDEFDKVIDWSLKGADKGKLVRLITEFNDLCDNSNLIMTSNKKVSAFVEAFRKLELPEEEVIRPFEDRLKRNPVYITIPTPETQAKIIANNLLFRISSRNLLDIRDEHGQRIDFSKFTNELEMRDKLQEIIYREISRHPGSNNINGRHLEVAMSSKLESELSGLASEKRDRTADNLGCSDDDWERLSAYQKAEKADIAINIDRIRHLVRIQQNDYLGETGNYAEDENEFTANSAFKKYLEVNLESIFSEIQKMGGDANSLKSEDLFRLFNGIYTKESYTNYDIYTPIPEKIDERQLYGMNGKKYLHCLKVTRFPDKDGRQLREPVVEIGFFERKSAGANSPDFDLKWSNPVKLSDFLRNIQQDIAQEFEKKFGMKGLFGNILKAVLGNAGKDPAKMFEMLIGEIQKHQAQGGSTSFS